IILLGFWASWCGPCMAEVPHLRGLATKFKDQPFAIVGVNGDPELSKAQHAVEELDIPWRSYWCGDKGPDGEIPRTWNVRGWPTVYVHDGNRVIRSKQVYGESREERLLQLLSDHDPIQSK